MLLPAGACRLLQQHLNSAETRPYRESSRARVDNQRSFLWEEPSQRIFGLLHVLGLLDALIPLGDNLSSLHGRRSSVLLLLDLLALSAQHTFDFVLSNVFVHHCAFHTQLATVVVSRYLPLETCLQPTLSLVWCQLEPSLPRIFADSRSGSMARATRPTSRNIEPRLSLA